MNMLICTGGFMILRLLAWIFKKARINPVAKEAHNDQGFSEAIRQGRPGM